jgi:cell division protease FtsH
MVIFDEITTGAESDLKQATALARRMVGLWGMSDEVGPVYLGTGEEHVFLGREIVQEKAFSDATATRLDMAVRDIVEASLGRANGMVSDNREKLELLVKALLEKETLDATEVTAILGPRPGGAPDTPISLDSAIEEQRTPVDLNGAPIGATE